MEYKDIASVSGKGGLFRIVSPNKSGVILESLDNEKKRMISGMSNRISVLEEISVYTHSADGSTPLKDVLHKMHSEFGDDLGVESNSDGGELKAFLKHILPDFDEARVYTSDIKKIVNWYNILLKEAPELLKSSENNEEGD